MEYDPRTATEVLARTPDVLHALLSDLSPAWIQGREGEGTWSPFDVVGHLIHGERTDWIPRARSILEGDGSFEPFDRFAQERESRGQDLADLLRTFARLRAENLSVLSGWDLGPRALARTGVHPEFGTVTLAQHLATWVAHDLAHLGQITRVMAKQYGSAIGPWRRYLPRLD